MATPIKMIKRRRIEIVAVERRRQTLLPASMLCPVCQSPGEFLTARQAGALAQVSLQSIYRWLARGKAHGVTTAGGRHRICRQSLFRSSHLEEIASQISARQTNGETGSTPNVYPIS